MSPCNIPRSLVILTILFKVISSQNCQCRYQRSNNIGTFSPSQMNTEVLCKDLASAIQNVVISKMRGNPGLEPILGTQASILPTSRHIHSPTSVLTTNSIEEVPNPAPCPICASNWQNSLARVLGLANSNLEQKSSPVPLPNPVSVPMPYSGYVSQGAVTVQEYPGNMPKNVNVPNVYPLAESRPVNPVAKCSANNLAMLLSGLPSNGNVYTEMVMVGGNGYRNP